jgi:Alpha/beta hydrolase family
MPNIQSAALNNTSAQQRRSTAKRSDAHHIPPIDMPKPYTELHDVAPPHLALMALEMRAFWEFGAVVPTWPALQKAPRADAKAHGSSVIVFPGLSAGDLSTMPLRKYLDSLGYATEGWNQGLNLGPRPGVLEAARQQITDTFNQSGSKVSLIGWSLGGVYARELAKMLPEMVHCVITLGTPFAGSPKSTNAWRVYEFASGRKTEIERTNFDLPTAPTVPTTSIYSKTDGVVAWQGSIQAPCNINPHTENIEVFASHVGMGLNPSAWWAVADRLSQKHASWKPFVAPRLMGLDKFIYPRHKRLADH